MLITKGMWIGVIILVSLLVPADVSTTSNAWLIRMLEVHPARPMESSAVCSRMSGGGRGLMLLPILRGGSSIDRTQGGTGGESMGYGGSSTQFSFRDLLSKRTGADGSGAPYIDDTDMTETVGWGGGGGGGGGKGTVSLLVDKIDLENMDAGALLERARRIEASGSAGYQDEAYRCIEICIRKDDCLPAAWMIKARLELDYKGDPLAATECANASLAAKSRNPDALFMLGYTSNNTAEARARFDAALKLYPYHGASLRSKGLLLLRGGAQETKKAMQMLDKATKESPLDPVPLLSFAYALSLCGDSIEAMRCVRAARGLGQGRVTLASVAADRAEAYLMRKRGQLDEAAMVLEACVLDVVGPDSSKGKVRKKPRTKYFLPVHGTFLSTCIDRYL
jgi:hypothetical protein